MEYLHIQSVVINPSANFQVGVPCTLLGVNLVDTSNDVGISQNEGINSFRDTDRRNALRARRIHKSLASTRLNRLNNRILARIMPSRSDIIFAYEKEYNSYRATEYRRSLSAYKGMNFHICHLSPSFRVAINWREREMTDNQK